MQPANILLAAALGLFHTGLSRETSNDSALTRRSASESLSTADVQHWVEDILDIIKSEATCAGCEGVLILLKGLAALGDDPFLTVLTDICVVSGAEDPDVCEGAIKLEGPIIAEAIRDMNIGSKASENFCLAFLGLCPYPSIDQWSVPTPSKESDRHRPPPSGKNSIKVVHYSDIHVDPLYVAGSSTSCHKPICCRPYTKSDEPGNSNSPAGPYGDHNCDVPIALETSMYDAIKDIVPDAAFTIFTGDIIDHAVWNTSKPYNEAEIKRAYGVMDAARGIVYGTAGNHEESPTNAFQPNSYGDNAQWVYNILSAEWSRWIGAAATTEAESLGAYSTKWPGGNLRIISLNTNMYYRQNYYLYRNDMLQDPNSQLVWLVQELDAAEKAGENVYIIGHMPFGVNDAFQDQSNYLDQIVQRYEATIAAMFFGHTHDDEFEISYSDNSKKSFTTAKKTSYIVPSLTPTSGNPSFRVYEVDPETFAVLDSITYMADMDNAAYQTSGPVWTKYYSAKEAYGSLLNPPITDPKAEISAAFWHNVTELFERDNSAFEAYMTRRSRGWKAGNCTGSCQQQAICQMRAARAQDNCFTPSPGLSFRKRSEDRVEERDECGVSVARAAIGALAVKKDALVTLHQGYIEQANARRMPREHSIF